MAVIQISKMQVRRGQTKQTNMPQLSSGEFGWSIDTQQLFIGNGSVTEGAPAVGNTEIITEHNINNFFLFAENGYKYYSTLTDVRSVFRTIQEKLDDSVSLKDFVTTGSDYTLSIQNAVNHASSIGKPLDLPEGTFDITATVYVPPLTEIRGAGLDKTIIRISSTASIFQTISKTGLRFEDGIQGDGSRPTSVKVNGVTFISSLTNAQAIFKADCLSDSIIENCGFKGDLISGQSTATLAPAISFRDISSYPANLTDNVTVKNCVFYGVGSAIVSDYDIANINILQNKFRKLDRGIVFGKNLNGMAGKSVGPKHVRIADNVFNGINYQAIYVGTTSSVSTSVVSDVNSYNNNFYAVGNAGQGDSTNTNVVEVIRFESWGNTSKGDNFDRLNAMNNAPSSSPFRQMYNGYNAGYVKPLIYGPASVDSDTPRVYAITDTSGDTFPFFLYPLNSYTYGINSKSNLILNICYTLTKPAVDVIRKGNLEIIVSNNIASGTAVFKDTYTANNSSNDGNIEFVVEVSPDRGFLTLKIKNQGSAPGTLTFTYTVRQ